MPGGPESKLSSKRQHLPNAGKAKGKGTGIGIGTGTDETIHTCRCVEYHRAGLRNASAVPKRRAPDARAAAALCRGSPAWRAPGLPRRPTSRSECVAPTGRSSGETGGTRARTQSPRLLRVRAHIQLQVDCFHLVHKRLSARDRLPRNALIGSSSRVVPKRTTWRDRPGTRGRGRRTTRSSWRSL